MAHLMSLVDTAEGRHSRSNYADRSDLDALASFATQVRNELRTHPEAQVVVEDDTVTVLRVSPSGPDVSVIFAEGRCTLAIGSWHDDVVSLDTVLEYVRMTVEGKLRVRIDQLGGKPWKYAIERRLDDGTWLEEGVVEMPRFSMFGRRKPTTRYLHNAAIT